jgi:hypothetical protein
MLLIEKTCLSCGATYKANTATQQRCNPCRGAWNQVVQEAGKILRRAMRLGEIRRLPCERCGHPHSLAHHENYSKPLDVIWLCATHHRRLHTALDRQAKKILP